jgi:dihydrodipicolinate synthase/N-acetylneuraminate lyase
MTQPLVSGIVVATVTPLTEGGDVDVEAFKVLVERLEAKGVQGLYVVGTVGESMYIRIDERVKIFEAALEARKNLKILASLMAATTPEAVENAKKLREVDVDAVFVTPPIYYRPSRESLMKHFVSVAEAADKPLFIYTISSYVGYVVPADVVRDLALEHSGIAGIKTTEPDLHHLFQIASEVKAERPDFTLLTGYGEYLLDALAAGADGAVDGISNVVPGLTASIYGAWRGGRYEEAVKLHRSLARLSVLFAKAGSLAKTLKALMKSLGVPMTTKSRIPEPDPDPETVSRLYELLCSDYRSYLVETSGCSA